MAPNQYDDLFATTTPSSDFDDFDLSTMLSCSPSLPKVRSLTPISLHRPHSSSVSSDSTYLTGDTDMSFMHDETSQEMYFSNSSNAPYYPMSMPSLQDVLSFSSSVNTGDAFTYDQQQWIPISGYPQPSSLVHYSDAPPSSIFPTFDTPSMSSASLHHPIPENATFNFNSNPQGTLQPQGTYLAASPAFSQAHSVHSHSRAGSIPSLSRSCSPNPSLFSGQTRARSSLSTPTGVSSNSNSNLAAYGILVSGSGSGANGATQMWRCAFPGCSSRATFTRGCDLRKHYNRHSKHLFCRHPGCPQSEPQNVPEGRRGSISATGGFSSKKDRARHEAKHNPGIRCEWAVGTGDGEECGRVFSRMDNMKDHVRRIHKKGGR